MEIIYPSLVEQAVENFSNGEDVTLEYKTKIYRALIEDQIIDEFGFPTKQALEKGYVESVSEEPYLEWNDFLEMYPVFEKYNKNEFEMINGFWEVSLEFRDYLIQEIQKDVLNYSQKEQIQEFLTGR